MTYYRVDTYSFQIVPVEVERESAHCLWVRTGVQLKRVMKDGLYEKYYASWEDARDALVHDAEMKLEHARRALRYAEDRRAALAGLSAPT